MTVCENGSEKALLCEKQVCHRRTITREFKQNLVGTGVLDCPRTTDNRLRTPYPSAKLKIKIEASRKGSLGISHKAVYPRIEKPCISKAGSYLAHHCFQRPFSLSRQVNRGGEREACKPRSILFRTPFSNCRFFKPEYHKPRRTYFL